MGVEEIEGIPGCWHNNSRLLTHELQGEAPPAHQQTNM